MAKWTRTACFASYGTKPRNFRWSWSARSDDGKTVVAVLWKDRFEEGTRLYRSHTHSHDAKWLSSPGHAELLENLAWARDNCDGQIRVIIGIAKDLKASPRSIEECYPVPALTMKITQLETSTGEFVLERASL